MNAPIASPEEFPVGLAGPNKATIPPAMFKILGPDGKESGPVSINELRQWITERRVSAQTRAQAEGTAEWKPLAEIPDLADAFKASSGGLSSASPPPLIRAGAVPVQGPPSLRPKMSGMAVASFLLGLFGICSLGITALVGLVLGIVALVQIRRRHGQMRGKGLAITGLCLSVLTVLIIPIALGLILPALAQLQHRGRTYTCVNNLQNVAMAVRLKAEESDGKFPAAGGWCDLILPNLQTPRMLACPARSNQRCGYAFNRNIAGRTVSSVPPETVMLIDSTQGWNATIGPEDSPGPSPHGGVYSVAFADGTVREVEGRELQNLRWEP